MNSIERRLVELEKLLGLVAEEDLQELQVPNPLTLDDYGAFELWRSFAHGQRGTVARPAPYSKAEEAVIIEQWRALANHEVERAP